MYAATRHTVRLSLIVVWLSVSLLQAATLERLSLDETIQQSTAIVRGRVLGSYAAYRGSVIYTHYRLEVVERWKGAQQSTVEVLVPGGVSAGFRQTYTGVPQLTAGKEYILFLWTGRGGLTQIIGYTQGVFELPKTSGKSEAMAFRAATSETMLDRETGRPVKDEPMGISVTALSSRIAAVLSKGAAR